MIWREVGKETPGKSTTVEMGARGGGVLCGLWLLALPQAKALFTEEARPHTVLTFFSFSLEKPTATVSGILLFPEHLSFS